MARTGRAYIGDVFVDLSGMVDGDMLGYNEQQHAIVPTVIEGGASAVSVREMLFTERASSPGAVYTADVEIPGGALIVDVVLQSDAVWTDGTSAALQIGDYTTGGVEIDADGFWSSELTVEDVLAVGQSISLPGNVGGEYTLGDGLMFARSSPDDRLLRAQVTVTDGDGDAGVTRVTVLYAVPSQTIEAEVS